MDSIKEQRDIRFIGSSLKDLNKLPEEIKEIFDFGIVLAAQGEKHVKAKPLQGFGGTRVLEIRESDRSGTYRAVYTTIFKHVVYVLHVFQKKSKSGIATPKQDIELIKQRLKRAELDYAENFKNEVNNG